MALFLGPKPKKGAGPILELGPAPHLELPISTLGS